MGLNHKDDLFMLQIRLFRLAQIRWGKMLLDDSLDLWMSGPDYITDEYRREIQTKRKNTQHR